VDAPEEHQPSTIQGSDLVKLTFMVPRSWRTALAGAAHEQGISMADLCRLVLRRFLRDRHDDAARTALESGA
jgi:hypothetical protein